MKMWCGLLLPDDRSGGLTVDYIPDLNISVARDSNAIFRNGIGYTGKERFLSVIYITACHVTEQGKRQYRTGFVAVGIPARINDPRGTGCVMPHNQLSVVQLHG